MSFGSQLSLVIIVSGCPQMIKSHAVTRFNEGRIALQKAMSVECKDNSMEHRFGESCFWCNDAMKRRHHMPELRSFSPSFYELIIEISWKFILLQLCCWSKSGYNFADAMACHLGHVQNCDLSCLSVFRLEHCTKAMENTNTWTAHIAHTAFEYKLMGGNFPRHGFMWRTSLQCIN